MENESGSWQVEESVIAQPEVVQEAPQPEVEEPKPPVYADSPYEITYAPKTKPPKAKNKSKTGKRIACAVLVLALVIASCTVTGLVLNGIWRKRSDAMAESFSQRLDVLQAQLKDATAPVVSGVTAVDGSLTPGQVYAQNMKSVVAITGDVAQSGMYGYGTYTTFGSGFILTPDGYVVSNHHVIEGAQTLTVITHDDQEYEAQIIGYDATNDISLLKIDAQDLPCVTIGSSDALMVGDQVAAIGNPLGELTSTLTVGYVSAKDRIVTTDGTAINMLQTDAAINSGNSGGPLFNMQGEVVGITTAKYSGTSSSGATIEGIGFAIPIDDVYGMLEDLRVYGYITGAYLGVMVRDVDAYGQGYGLPAGVYVEEVTAGTAAEKAGIAQGDIITNLGGYDVTCMSDLSRALRKFRPGEQISITVYRRGHEEYLSIVLDEKPREEVSVQQEQESAVVVPDDDGVEDWYEEFIRRFYGG